MTDPKLVKAYEWSTDYHCPDCGVTFNVADDSDAVFERNLGHVCDPFFDDHGIPHVLTYFSITHFNRARQYERDRRIHPSFVTNSDEVSWRFLLIAVWGRT